MVSSLVFSLDQNFHPLKIAYELLEARTPSGLLYFAKKSKSDLQYLVI